MVDGLVAELIKQRADARARKDFAAADAIRDSLAASGVEVSDTPQGPRWSVRRSDHDDSVVLGARSRSRCGLVRATSD